MDAREPFQRFEIQRQQPVRDPETGQWTIGHVTETIDSVHKLRQVEEDSAQRYANGEGEPFRFRRWNQDDSNRDVHTFGEIPQEKPTDEAKRRFGLTAGASALVSEDGSPPDVAFGEGVNESNTSALKGGL